MTRPQRPEEARWRSVHAMGDRNPPIVLGDRRKRQLSSSMTIWQRGKSDGAVYE